MPSDRAGPGADRRDDAAPTCSWARFDPIGRTAQGQRPHAKAAPKPQGSQAARGGDATDRGRKPRRRHAGQGEKKNAVARREAALGSKVKVTPRTGDKTRRSGCRWSSATASMARAGRFAPSPGCRARTAEHTRVHERRRGGVDRSSSRPIRTQARGAPTGELNVRSGGGLSIVGPRERSHAPG